MIIIALAGRIGCGKDTFARYISKKYGFGILDYAQILRNRLKEEGIEINRTTLTKYRQQHGKTFLAEDAVKKILESGKERILLTPMRYIEDFEIPKKQFEKTFLVFIKASKGIRFSRLKKRERENDPKTVEEFESQEKKELETFDIDKLEKMADFKINNDGDLKKACREIDGIMEKIL